MKEFFYLTSPIDTSIVVYKGYPFENRLFGSNSGAKTAISYYDDKTPVAK